MNLSAIEDLLKAPTFRCLEWDNHIRKWRVLLVRGGRCKFFDGETVDQAVDKAMAVVTGMEVWE